MDKLVFTIDIETNGLLSDMLDFSSFPYKLKPEASLWCVVIRNVYTDEYVTAVQEEITSEWMENSLKGASHIIAHNGIKFDFVALKLFGVLEYKIGYPGQDDEVFGIKVSYFDSLVVSRLLNPDRYGGHSLEAWGKRVDNFKIGFREICIEKGIIEKGAPRGAEFLQYCDSMLDYCIGDTSTNRDVFFALLKEMSDYKGWRKAIKMENKLADLAVRRESLGFFFDKPLALELLEDLGEKMTTITNNINPILPKKPMNKREISGFTPPKKQLNIHGEPTAIVLKFAEKVGGEIVENDEDEWFLSYEGNYFKLPHHEPLKTHIDASIDNLDHVKMYLIELGWEPTEWRERDLTKDSKKQNISYEKRVAALEKWANDTFAGKYKKQRLEIVGMKEDTLIEKMKRRLKEDKPVRVPTSPSVRVGVEKELCPSLTSLGEKVGFAKDFSLYLTYKHRKSSIAGGDIEDMDFDTEYPNTGFLSMYREVDQRVATPAIEIGANTNRYRHIGIANIPRPTSTYGEEMRKLFGAGKKSVFYGFDFASIEARIMAHYVFNYTDGEELGKTFVAEKPNDLHTKMAEVMGIPRSEAKSINYGIIYGASWKKIKKMTGKSDEDSKVIVDNFWSTAVALKEFRDKAVDFWKNTGNSYVPAIDGRKIFIRSEHSILNALFQSAAVIYAKYVTVELMQKLEEDYKLCIDPFEAKPDVCSMIEYHDEVDMFANPKLFKFEIFETKENAEVFIQNWSGEQLSALGHNKNKYYVCLPNSISISTTQVMRKIEKDFKINVPMGFEFMLGNTWYDCH